MCLIRMQEKPIVEKERFAAAQFQAGFYIRCSGLNPHALSLSLARYQALILDELG
jgi:hypothetical protein